MRLAPEVDGSPARRPEAIAGLIECYRRKLPGPQSAVPFVKPLAEKLKAAKVLQEVEQHRPMGMTGPAQGTHLLPMAFPEGSPMHPSYGAGHATVAGACVTVLKAFFDESAKLPFAFQADADDPTKLQHLSHLDNKLTVGGELNKLASNISIGRNMAGVHYFTDYIESIRLGEQIACAILEEQAVCYREDFSMTFTSFDRAADRSPIDVTIEKTGNEVVKRHEVRQIPPAAGATVLPIAAE
jgi:membrane-associated phospholipid phosphatase